MDKEYYPDSYLRKRKRDTTLMRVFIVLRTVGIIGVALVAGVLLYNYVLKPMRTPPADGEQMAAQREELETQQRLDEANKEKAPAATPTQESASEAAENASSSGSVEPVLTANVLSEIDYSNSLPLVQVSLHGSNDGNADIGESVKDEPAEAVNETPDATGAPDERLSRDDEPATDDKPAESQTKPAETKPADKPETKPKEEPKVEEKPKTNTGGKYRWKVFAGFYDSTSEAEGKAKDLGALGLKASVEKSGPQYILVVGVLDDKDAAEALRNKLVSNGFGANVIRLSK